MEIITKPLTIEQIVALEKEVGDYLKVTADIFNKLVVVGTRLHADGEKLLLENGSQQDNIWGGGIDLETKTIDTTAVLNIRPRLNNDSMEILDNQRREEFINTVKFFFAVLWS